MAMMAPTILRMREIVLFLNRLGSQPLTNAPTMMVMMAFNIAWMFLKVYRYSKYRGYSAF
jgi:hypothetical protein